MFSAIIQLHKKSATSIYKMTTALQKKNAIHFIFSRPIKITTLLFCGAMCHACKDTPKQPQEMNINVRLVAEPERVNPWLTEESSALQLAHQLYQPLLGFDPATHELKPILAKSKPTSQPIDTGILRGGTIFTFELHDSARWDNGTPVTAADVEFSFKAVLSPFSGANNMRSGIDFVRKFEIDSQNVRKFRILTGQKYINSEANIGNLPILPKYVYDADDQLKKYSLTQLALLLRDSAKSGLKEADLSALQHFGQHLQHPKFSRSSEGVIGSGAYRLEEWVTGQRIVLRRKKNWWGDSFGTKNPMLLARPEKITYLPVPDEATAVSMLQNGQIDAMNRLSSRVFLELQKDSTLKDKYHFRSFPTLAFSYIGFNCKSPKLNDKRTRRALAHLTETQLVITKMLNGFGENCNTPFAPSRDYYHKGLKTILLDTAKAKALLAAAGWKDTDNDDILDKMINGQKVKLEIRFSFAQNNTLAKNIAFILQENAKPLKIKVSPESLDAKILLDKLRRRDFDLFFSSFLSGHTLDDPKEIWATSSDTPDGSNRFGFGNKQTDALIEQIRRELDPEKRKALYYKFQEILYEEQPAIFLFSPKEKVVISKKFNLQNYFNVQGYQESQFQWTKKD